MEVQEIKIHNPGILYAKMDTDVFKELAESCDFQIKNKNLGKAFKRNSFADTSVQGIEESFIATPPKSYTIFLQNFAKSYAQYFNFYDPAYCNPVISQCWINLQKKHEYRPAHYHSDGNTLSKNLSFVTYVKIPYNLSDEDSYSNYTKLATRYRNGRIEFIYNTLTGLQKSKSVDVSSEFEGGTLLFLNSLMHLVYPFYTSDEYRISVAGNISFTPLGE